MVSGDPWAYLEKLSYPRMGVAVCIFILFVGPNIVYAQQGYSPDSLFIVLFSNGDALVEYDVQIATPLAEEVPVQLFGRTIGDLIVTDFEDRIVSSKPGTSPNEIILSPAGATDIRISYSTSDLVGKTLGDRVWTFAIDSPINFSLKMPPNSVPFEFGEITPTYTQIGSQTLLTFRAGSASVSYIVGFIDDETQADLAITFARTSMDIARRENPDIILSRAQEMISQATEARSAGQFIDAQRLAAQASDLVEEIVRDFDAAIAARAEARTRILQAEAEDRDTVGANALLEQSNQEFAAGDYANATHSAEAAIRAIGEPRQTVWPFGVGAAIAGAIAGSFYLMRKRHSQRLQPANVHPDSMPQHSAEPVHWPKSHTSIPDIPDKPVIEPETRPVIEPETRPARAADSQIDKTLLAGIVDRIIQERPHLRKEDRDVLIFLAQSEGAAFESEVRTRFQMPKTTVWRLVKRLEREELVEIRKAGGQNLIKLRFEGRQP